MSKHVLQDSRTPHNLLASVPRQTRVSRIEPTARLTWSEMIELPRAAGSAATPAGARKAWIHRAPEGSVLELFRSSAGLPGPWWLRALAAGTLPTRAAGFELEDRLAEFLATRAGWTFVPWVAEGESGFWEFTPSESGPAGYAVPTTLLNTDRHRGWIDVLPAHAERTVEPIAVDRLAGLRARIAEFEAMR